MSRDIRDLLQETARSPQRDVNPDALWRRARRERWGVAGSATALLLVLVALVAVRPPARSVLLQPGLNQTGWQEIRVADAIVSVPANWPVRRIDGQPMPCDLAWDVFPEPVLYVAEEYPREPRDMDCGLDPGEQTIGVFAFRLSTSPFAIPPLSSRWDENAVEVNGVEVIRAEDTPCCLNHAYLTLTAPSLDLQIRIRAMAGDDLPDQIFGRLRPARGATPRQVRERPTSVPEGLPEALVTSWPGIASLDPVTGELKAKLVPPRFEGPPQIALRPGLAAVYFTDYTTHCSARLVAVPLGGGSEAIIAENGFHPAFSPDGRQLAYARGACGENGELVIHDLETRSERVLGVTPPPGLNETIGKLSWSGDGRSIAFEVRRGTQVDEWTVEGPFETEIRVVDLEQHRSLGEARVLRPGDGSAVWHLPAFRGELGTLAVVEACCSGDHPSEADPSRILELDALTGEVLDILLETDGAIRHLDADKSGEHLLYVITRNPDWLRLYRWHRGEAYPLADEVEYADW